MKSEILNSLVTVKMRKRTIGKKKEKKIEFTRSSDDNPCNNDSSKNVKEDLG